MLEVTGNLWSYKADIRVITTNGTVKKDGCAVMGRGCAREATKIYPNIQLVLGERLARFGNMLFELEEFNLISFPVKHEWYQKADYDLINKSALDLEVIVKLEPHKTFVMPRPGCGNGGLEWEKVKTLIGFLPDNVHVIDFGR